MPKRKNKHGGKSRQSLYMVLVGILLLLAILAWRGVEVAEGEGIPPTLTWRVADDADLF